MEPEDLIQFGLIPELVGRVPIISPLEGLTELDLSQILLEPKNSIIKQYKKLFALDKVELIFEPKIYLEIAKKAIDRRTGARGLRAIVENLLLEVMYEAPSKKSIKSIYVSVDNLLKNTKPDITYFSKDEEQNRQETQISVVKNKE